MIHSIFIAYHSFYEEEELKRKNISDSSEKNISYMSELSAWLGWWA
jgi:hypothetical protein